MFLIAPTLMLATGCVVKEKEVVKVVKEPPPAPTPPPLRIEERGVAPTTTYAWIPGHWEWNGRDWDWAHGKWVEPPYTEAVWVPSQWEWNDHEWVWVPGHWKQ